MGQFETRSDEIFPKEEIRSLASSMSVERCAAVR